MYVRAVLCQCRRRLEAENDEVLRVMVRKHLTDDHAAVRPIDEQVTRIVSTRAYDIEYAGRYAGPEGMAEEFGPEPY